MEDNKVEILNSRTEEPKVQNEEIAASDSAENKIKPSSENAVDPKEFTEFFKNFNINDQKFLKLFNMNFKNVFELMKIKYVRENRVTKFKFIEILKKYKNVIKGLVKEIDPSKIENIFEKVIYQKVCVLNDYDSNALMFKKIVYYVLTQSFMMFRETLEEVKEKAQNDILAIEKFVEAFLNVIVKSSKKHIIEMHEKKMQEASKNKFQNFGKELEKQLNIAAEKSETILKQELSEQEQNTQQHTENTVVDGVASA